MGPIRRPGWLLAAALAAAVPGSAQEERDQMERHEADDRAYEQRVRRQLDRTVPEDADRPRRALLDALERPRVRRARTATLELVTDDPRLDLEAIGSLLDDLTALADGLPLPARPAAPDEPPGTVVLAWSSYALRRADPAGLSHRGREPERFYHAASDTIAVHTDGGNPSALTEAIVDLAAHRLVERRIELGGEVAPAWLRRGLAHELAGTFRDGDGAFRSGVVGGKSVLPIRGAPADRGEVAAARLRHALRTWRASAYGDGSGVDRLLDRSARDASVAGYGIAWGVVHYLRHGNDGAHRARFDDWVRGTTSGAHGRGLLDELGLDAARLEAAVVEHVGSLDARPRIRWSVGAGGRGRVRVADCGRR